MGREVFQYKEVDTNDFLRVNQSTITLEFFHTATYTTAASSGGTDTSLVVADRGGFANGDTVLIGTNSDVIASGGGTTGPGTLTLVTGTSWSNNDAVIKGGAANRSTWYDDPDFGTGVTTAITLDSNNEAVVFLKPGQYGVVFSSGGSTLRADYHEVVEELDWVTVTQEHASTTAGIGEAILKLASGGGTVYIPPGTYNVTANIDVTSNVRIVGAGVDITTIKVPNGTGNPGAADEGILELAGNDNIEICDLTIDGNQGDATNGASAQDDYHGIHGTGGNTDIRIHDVKLTLMKSGVKFDSGTDSQRVSLRNVYVTDVGDVGLHLTDIHDSEVMNCNVVTSGAHGISIGGSDFRCIGNNVDRSSAPTHITDAGAQSGNLLDCIQPTNRAVISGNTFNNNKTANNDGVEFDIINIDNVIFSHNIIKDAGGSGVVLGNNMACSNNIIITPGVHGITLNGGATAITSVAIADNFIVDCDEDNAGGAHGINITIGAGNADVVSVTGNVVTDQRGTQRTVGGIQVTTSAGTVASLIITGNDFSDVKTQAATWTGTNITSLRWRNNQWPSAETTGYSGEATLANGTKALTNTNWPAIAGLVFNISRTDDNSSTAVGQLKGVFDGTDTLNITSQIGASANIQIDDVRDNIGYPVADAATTALVITHGASTTNMEPPAAVAVQDAYFFVKNMGGGTSIDIFLEDSNSTRLTTSVTVSTATAAGTWNRMPGNGTATALGRTLRVVGENEVGAVASLNVDRTSVVFAAALATVTTETNDASKVFWEFLGTAS